jgi:hypothetical protein
MKRAKSYSEPNQGNENTCALHTLARLFVHNVIQPDVCPLTYQGEEIPPNEHDSFTSQCGDLMTVRDDFDPEQLTPDTCGGVRYYISTLMYLYAYHCVHEQFPDVACDGANLQGASSALLSAIQQQHIPPILISKEEDIRRMLPSYIYVHVFAMHHTTRVASHPHVFNGLDDLRYRAFMDLSTKADMYTGLILKKRGVMGHVLTVAGYSARENMYTLKNTWGLALDKLHGDKLKGPHYELDKAINEEDYVSVEMNDPVRGVVYMGIAPWEQLFIQAGYHPYKPFPVYPVKPTRTPARKVGEVRVKPKSVSRSKVPKKATRSLTRSYSPHQTRRITTTVSNKGDIRAHSLHRRV